VAQTAGVPLSQVHYHFGSKQKLIMELLGAENARRLARQTEMYAADQPLWRRYEQACDFLDDDLASGFVRVLQEMVAAGWSDPVIGEGVRDLLQGWLDLITEVALEAEHRFGPLGPFPADEFATLIGLAFMGGESMLLLGFDRRKWPVRSALRRIGVLIRSFEEATP
jgi:AcrR family transcriptional regulator